MCDDFHDVISVCTNYGTSQAGDAEPIDNDAPQWTAGVQHAQNCLTCIVNIDKLMAIGNPIIFVNRSIGVCIWSRGLSTFQAIC